MTSELIAKKLSERTRKILLVDDSDLFRKVARSALEGFGYTVTEAESGESAMEHMKIDMPDMVMTDLIMPGMGGLDLANYIRDNIPGLSVLICSGSDEAVSAVEQDHFVIKKPFHLERLRESVDKLWRKK